MSGIGTQPHDALEGLVAKHGLPCVLMSLSFIAAGMGSVCSTILAEVASIETWLQQNGRQQP